MDPQLLIRSIFSRFRDLNLVTLMQNLRVQRVARGEWMREGRLCPLAHGFPGGQLLGDVMDGVASVRVPGVDADLVSQFLVVWDGDQLSDADLLTELNCLWRERRADTDAVQYLLAAPEEAAVA